MAIGYIEALRTARLEAFVTQVGSAGKLKLYTTPRPATGAAAGAAVLLGTLTWAASCKTSNTGGVLTLAALTADSSADASGTAVWARVTTSADVFVADMAVTATGGGGDIQMNSTAVIIGGTIAGLSGTITDGNP